MKTLIIISSFLLLMASCHSLIEEESPLNEKVKLTVSNEEFTVDFTRSTCVHSFYNEGKSNSIKTRDSLINRYKNIRGFSPGFSEVSMVQESIVVTLEYMLAQECFSDHCDSKTRKEILQLVVDKQKAKNDDERYVYLPCALRTGVFLMAVILVKERSHSAKHIDAATLQKALLCLNDDELVIADFSNIIIECSKKFLIDNK